MGLLAYKANAADAIERLRTLYGRRAEDRIFAVMEPPSRTVAEFRATHSEGPCAFPDLAERAAFWDKLCRERAALEDDSIPSAYPSELDQALYGGLLGGEARFLCNANTGWISSMVPPLLRDWSEFDRLRFDPHHPWWERYLTQLRVFSAAAADKFGVSHFILIDNLNFVFELFGATDTYVSLTERPEMVRRAAEFSFDLNVRVQEEFFARVPLLAGGTCSNMVQWAPGRILNESVDPFHMASVPCFEEWGREPVERIFARFDGGVLHIHGNGRHLLPAVATLRGLRAVYAADDRGFPRAFDVIAELKQRVGDLPLIVSADYPSFADRLARRQLVGGVLYHVYRVPGADDANRCMNDVRSYRA